MMNQREELILKTRIQDTEGREGVASFLVAFRDLRFNDARLMDPLMRDRKLPG